MVNDVGRQGGFRVFGEQHGHAKIRFVVDPQSGIGVRFSRPERRAQRSNLALQGQAAHGFIDTHSEIVRVVLSVYPQCIVLG